MFWADQIVAEIEKTFPGKRKFIVRDEKTASGRVHVGSLRGVVIHAVITQALIEKGYDAEFFFELNDADPMDGLPVYLSKDYELYMGKPLKDVPPPSQEGEPDITAFQKDPKKNFARYFGDEFIEVIHRLGFKPTFYYASDFYREGKFDRWIDIVLEYPDEIRKVYKEVSGSEKGEEWNPLQIVCENCGKVGTTTVVASEGGKGAKIVEYTCEPKKVKWANGCGHRGKTSPYKGRGKLPWKVEWAVKWNIFPVDIEGSGKDHNAAGGSHDVAAGIVNEVLKKADKNAAVPFNIPYEHFLFGGKKMSASKGIGASAKEVSEILPPELLRFLMTRPWPHQHIDFDPSGGTIPRLFDAYDEAAEVYFDRKTVDANDDTKRAFYFSQIDRKNISDHFRPRFSRVAFILQMPQLDFWKELERLKGSKLVAADQKEAETRMRYAKSWLQKYALEAEKFEVQKSLPKLAEILTKDQKNFLQQIAELLQQKAQGGEELHHSIHELRKNSMLKPAEAFQAIYIVLLGKASGPQAGWFLEALDKDFVIQRLLEASK